LNSLQFAQSLQSLRGLSQSVVMPATTVKVMPDETQQQQEQQQPPAPEIKRPQGWVSFPDWMKRGLDINDYPKAWREGQEIPGINPDEKPNPDSAPGGTWQHQFHQR
jgi:hypothetical protein